MGFFSWLQKVAAGRRPLPWLWDVTFPLPNESEFGLEANEHAQALYLEALQAHDLGDNERAIELYSTAIRVVPIFWEALDNRGLCHMRRHDFVSAIPDFELSIRIAPNSSLAYVALYECYKRTKQWKKAYYTTRETLRLWPDKAPFGDFSWLDKKDQG